VTAYLVRRLLYSIPILFGVNVLTFALFFLVNSPDQMARKQLGEHRVTPDAVDKWKADRGYDQPLVWNSERPGIAAFRETVFFATSVKLFSFQFGQSDSGRDIGYDIRERMGPSLAIALPALLAQVVLATTLALLVTLWRGAAVDRSVTIICVALMSVSSLFYIMAGQYVMAKLLRLVPVSGYGDGWAAAKFVVLPVIVQVLASLGANVRWYRSIFLEENAREYVRTARSKGLSNAAVMVRHVLRNALLPLLTNIVVILPSLFLGSLITESFFAIPGLGSYTIDAIQNQDFAAVRAMVFLGSLLYIIGLMLTDISYAWADPRVRLSRE
jgi:peptide/nickel transport system permease protein